MVATKEQQGIEFGVPMDERKASHPWLQASSYQPAFGQVVQLVISPESVALLDEETQDLLVPDPGNSVLCRYNKNKADMFPVPANARFAILSMPRIFGLNKDTGEISPLQKGEKLRESGRRTIARLLLAVILDNKTLLMDTDGNPYVFTLKLKSTATAWIGSDRDKEGSRTIFKANQALQEAWGRKSQWVLSFASVEIKLTAVERESSGGDASSMGVEFGFGDGIRPLPRDIQETIFNFITTDKFKKLARNPFEGERDDEAQEEVPSVSSDLDDIPL